MSRRSGIRSGHARAMRYRLQAGSSASDRAPLRMPAPTEALPHIVWSPAAIELGYKLDAPLVASKNLPEGRHRTAYESFKLIWTRVVHELNLADVLVVSRRKNGIFRKIQPRDVTYLRVVTKKFV